MLYYGGTIQTTKGGGSFGVEGVGVVENPETRGPTIERKMAGVNKTRNKVRWLTQYRSEWRKSACDYAS